MSKTRKALEARINKAAKDKSLIGAIASCTARDLDFTYDDLENLCKQVGLDRHLYPARPSARKAFTKAIKETRREASGFLFRPIFNSPEEKIVGVVNEKKLKATKDLDYSVDCKITLDKVNEAIKTSGKDKAGHGKRVKALFTQMYTKVLSRDLKEWFRKTLRNQLAAVKLADEGTTYFVPATMIESVQRIAAVIDTIGRGQISGGADPRTHANVFLLPDSYDNKAKAAVNVKAGLMGELEELQKEIADWQANPPRLDTMERRMEEYDNMAKRAKMFVSMLDINADNLVQSLTDCKKMVGRLLKVQVKEIGEEGMEKRAKRKVYRQERKERLASGAAPKKKDKAKTTKKPMASKVKQPIEDGKKTKGKKKDKAKKKAASEKKAKGDKKNKAEKIKKAA